MKWTIFPKPCFAWILLVCGGLEYHFAFAKDASEAQPADPAAEFGSAADRGRLAWAVLEAIERDHINPPPRNVLISRLSYALLGVHEETPPHVLRDLNSDWILCQSADEMADLTARSQLPGVSLDQFIENLTRGISKLLGEARLIRARDHDVEEQFRGNRYVGLGVTLRTENALPVFATIMPGGPAERAGLEPNTVIHEIDGRFTKDVPLQTIVDWLRGPQGSDVTLGVLSPKGDLRDLTLTRGVIRMASLKNQKFQSIGPGEVKWRGSEPIGWITFEKISSSTLHELRTADHQAKTEGLRVLVLDFRHGGQSEDLHQALLIADSFLDGGPIWEQTDRASGSRIEFADRECLFRGLPIVVLIDQNSGTAHCAIAAALQDAGRAQLVGESPDFEGRINTIVRLDGVPYSLMIETTRLQRMRPDRQWPLVPDFPSSVSNGPSMRYPDEILHERTTGPDSPRHRRSSTSSVMKKTRVGTEPTITASTPTASTDLQTSYLSEDPPAPAVHIQPLPLIKQPQMGEIAIRLARELLATSPSDPARPISEARNRNDKDLKQ